MIGVVTAQAIDPVLADDLERRWLLIGVEAAEARDLERVLGRGADPGSGARERLGQQLHLAVT